MKISELIEKLTKIKDEHGDLRVGAYNFSTEDGCMVVNANATENVEEDFYFQGDAPCRGKCCMLIG